MKIKNSITIGVSLFTLFTLSGCVTKSTNNISSNFKKYQHRSTPIPNLKFQKVTYGRASYYGKKFNGKQTASGEIYNMNAKTAAHKTLPFNTMVRVTDMVSNRSDIVRINDREPSSSKRIIDLSYASAKKLGLINRGITDVKIEIIGYNGKINRRLTLPTSTQACIGNNCKASIQKEKQSKETSKFIIQKPIINESEYDAKYNERFLENESDSVYDDNPYLSSTATKSYPEAEQFSTNSSIQVGAFRRYAGAKIYAKRYGLLSNRYKTIIKKDIKNAKPLYRVRIEGFANEHEARTFISRYSLNGAFLVKR